ncbi:Protein of unknown function [Gryllus bimaculatus]|nr:Protein of unknown function [Gryllus bimaculatus]
MCQSSEHDELRADQAHMPDELHMRREVDWSKHPSVARPSQVTLPFLAFARRPAPHHEEVRRRELHTAAPRSRLIFEVPRRPDFRYAY